MHSNTLSLCGDITVDSTRPRPVIWLVLAVALIAGLAARQWAYSHTASLRFELNQQNAFYWGDRIVHGENSAPGPASWKTFWRSYVAVYEADAAHPAPKINTLDYVPLRLLMAGVWVNYLNWAYGPVSQWRPEFARSFSAFSMVMELAGAAAMFALVSRFLLRVEPRRKDPQWPGIAPPSNRRWEMAAAAATLMWLNPASIVDSHIWPHGQTWILPFYLAAVLAMIEQRCFVAGAIFGVGAMFKGQMMLVAPMLILWPLFDRRWWGGVRVAVGMICGVGAIVWPWVSHGSFAWVHASFASNGMFSDVLRKGQSLNLPAFLANHWHMTLHQHLFHYSFSHIHLALELKSLLICTYLLTLVCVSWGISRQARLGDRRLLVSIAAPWALMFFILGQMDERYLVWSACFSAAAVAVGWWAIGAHLILTWAGAVTMIEFLLICKPDLHPAIMHRLLMTNPLTLLATAVAVGVLMVSSLCASKPRRISERIDGEFFDEIRPAVPRPLPLAA